MKRLVFYVLDFTTMVKVIFDKEDLCNFMINEFTPSSGKWKEDFTKYPILKWRLQLTLSRERGVANIVSAKILGDGVEARPTTPDHSLWVIARLRCQELRPFNCVLWS